MPQLDWLGAPPCHNVGTTFGVPWPRGQYFADRNEFVCVASNGSRLPLQTWITAYWPDGSIKWTGNAISSCAAAGGAPAAPSNITVKPIERSSRASDDEDAHADVGRINLVTYQEAIEVDTGRIRVVFATSGSSFIRTIVHFRFGKAVAEDGHLVLRSQSAVDAPHITTLQGRIEKAEIESQGPVRTVVRIEGRHQPVEQQSTTTTTSSSQPCLPFILRCYLYAESETIRMVYTTIYDQSPADEFIRGIGVRFRVPLEDEAPYDRHIRIAGADGGIFSEAVQGLTGLWKDPGTQVRQAQVAGQPVPPIEQWNNNAEFVSRLQWVPRWNDFTLLQLSPDGYTMKKRTKSGNSWVNIPGATRSGGFVYLGGARRGGLGMGLRHFWERYPTQIDVRDADTERGEITMWLYSPSAEPMDLRPYHDGLGQKTYDDQLDALQITYEDWEPNFGTPYGIARTNELYLYASDSTPPSPKLSRILEEIRSPPLLVAQSDSIHRTEAFGTYWSPQSSWLSRSPRIDDISRNLDFLFTFYQTQIVQRRWYGFWDHGDIMHTYDADRHTWRYDVGGYAWDNSELSPDLWLWLYFLCTRREDVFRLAENFTRHTSEVDMYHLGPYKGLGTRHGVQHWSDSCKQARVSNALYRRYFYYLTGGDERIGDIMQEALEAEGAFRSLDPYRKVRKDRESALQDRSKSEVLISLGTDWSALAAAWFIEWERRGPRWKLARGKLFESMQGIAKLKNGFVTGQALLHLENGRISPPPSDQENHGHVQVSHLSAMFGLVETCAEIIDALSCLEDDKTESEDSFPFFKSFRSAWLDYCIHFNGSATAQITRYGIEFPKLILRQGHSRLTAYAAKELGDKELARRAWREFYNGDGYASTLPWKSDHVDGSKVPVVVDEAIWVSTNITALYGLAAIQGLGWNAELIGIENLNDLE